MTPEEIAAAAAKLAEEEAAATLAAEEEAAIKLAAEEAAAAAAAAEEEPEFELDEDGNPKLDEDGNPIVVEKPAWMVEEQDPDPSKQVPVGKFVATKKKLKGQISDRDTEIEQLKLENARLAKLKPKEEETTLVRPKRDDFDTEEEFDNAFDTYNQSRTTEAINRTRLEDEQKAGTQQAQEELTAAVDGHYERAEVLIEKSGIKPEVYKAADTTVRKAVEAVIPNLGDVVTDQVISILGEGSEKVMFFLGRNKVALATFQSLLISDPSGMKAAVYLGQEKQRLTNPLKPRSSAPAPATGIKGDITTATGVEAKFKKKYDTAHGKVDLQLAYNAKKEARAAGVDVSGW